MIGHSKDQKLWLQWAQLGTIIPSLIGCENCHSWDVDQNLQLLRFKSCSKQKRPPPAKVSKQHAAEIVLIRLWSTCRIYHDVRQLLLSRNLKKKIFADEMQGTGLVSWDGRASSHLCTCILLMYTTENHHCGLSLAYHISHLFLLRKRLQLLLWVTLAAKV